MSWLLIGSLLPIWSTIAFWIPKKPLTPMKYAQQIYDMHRNLQCLQAALTEMTQFFSMTMLDRTSHNQCFKSWMNWAMRFFSHPPHSPDLLPRDYYFFQYLNNFVQGKCFHNQQEAENAFQEIVESWSMDFLCYRNKQTLFLVGKTALILMVPILINKNMFEPCYNDLKFTVWNY